MATQATTSRKTTTRFPNSTTGWRLSGGVRCWREQVGQSGQPRPESESRTAAPVTMLARSTASVTRHRRRNRRGPICSDNTGFPWYRRPEVTCEPNPV